MSPTYRNVYGNAYGNAYYNTFKIPPGIDGLLMSNLVAYFTYAFDTYIRYVQMEVRNDPSN